MEAKVRRLLCAVCGVSTHGRQWWNRDTGYGVCVRCAEECHESERESLYGRRGEHWGIGSDGGVA